MPNARAGDTDDARRRVPVVQHELRVLFRGLVSLLHPPPPPGRRVPARVRSTKLIHGRMDSFTPP